MELQTAIKQLYQTFEAVQPPDKVVLFKCVSCVSAADEQYLFGTPIGELNDHIFGSIMEACNTVPMGDQRYKYYIPRILELITSEDPDFSFPFVEYVYRDLAKFDYQNQFSLSEKQAVDGFFEAFLWQEFNRPFDELDEAVLFDVAEVGYYPIPLLRRLMDLGNWPILRKAFNEYLDMMAQQLSEEENGFEGWCQKGKRQAVIAFLGGGGLSA